MIERDGSVAPVVAARSEAMRRVALIHGVAVEPIDHDHVHERRLGGAGGSGEEGEPEQREQDGTS